MPNGDDAIDAGMDIVLGTEDRRNGYDEINKTRDYIAQRTAAAAVRSSLGLPAAVVEDNSVGHAIKLRYESGVARIRARVDVTEVGDLAYVGDVDGKVSKAGDTMSGALFLGSAAPVTSGYVAMYRNGDGRVGVSPSALKYKRAVKDYDGSVLDLRPVTYVLKDDPQAVVRIGVIADEANDVEPMLVVHEDGEVESFKYELLAVALLKEVQRLTARVAALEGDTP